MKYVSTRDHDYRQLMSFTDAVLNGLAPDGGLYMPQHFPVLPAKVLKKFSDLSLSQIAWQMLIPFVDGDFSEQQLSDICDQAFNFHLPTVQLEANLLCLELFHGPTMAFKDVGARFMARVLSCIAQQKGKEIKVVVATSGDTGSAVASGFFKVPGIRVFILFPKGRVSTAQQMQLTTWGENITAIEIEGGFDDCQHCVKQLLSAQNQNNGSILTSANSINIARLLPQMVYYAKAWAENQDKNLIFSVPSGNFGNLTAGLMAAAMGVPVKHFIAATNVNDVVPLYLKKGTFIPRPSVATLSNAMDVGNPSNFERMLHLFGNNHNRMQTNISGIGFADTETLHAMQQLHEHYGYVADPHGAIGYLGAKHFASCFPGATFVFLETAHPAKFSDTTKHALGIEVEVPERLAAFFSKKEQKITLPNDFQLVHKLVCGA
jgi:threonine synthase